uniref:Putative ovule protein n=1 Tax=Solanum chacoense TaxID=4108 RepID=A0A0V0HC07_SOLCH
MEYHIKLENTSLHNTRISTLQPFRRNIKTTNKQVNRDMKYEISQELNYHHTSISTSHMKENSTLIQLD